MLNPLNHELNPICYLLALLGAHHFLHDNRIRAKFSVDMVVIGRTAAILDIGNLVALELVWLCW